MDTTQPGTVLIRADAGSSIGTGHVMRCLALSQAWQDSGGTTVMVAAELPDALVPRLTAEDLAATRIYAVPGSLEDALETVVQARRIGANWVVVDGDRFGSEFLETVRVSGLPVLLIDDFANRKSYPVDLIVNPNLDEDPAPYRQRGTSAPVCMGPSFLLLRREFRLAAAEPEIRHLGNRVLVTLGGSDPDDLSMKIGAALSDCSGLEVTVLAGAGYDKVDELRRLDTGKIRVLFNPSNMARIMRDSDMAIIAAGGTLWELLSVGCAVLSYSRNRMQARVVQALSGRGAVVSLGETRCFDPARLVECVTRLAAAPATRERMATLGRALVDGLGATRVVKAAQQFGAPRR